ncbi:Spy/CpxP family protein refolding chaperone [Gemmatimonas sp.]|uniref:Spy/CpxP family protein refolding chaperone n=1 Tax=Gemmatimonas sp. TaxID=1962908 RepID=UPI00286D6B8E|nr:Spy/CpxP family protein refolding chaperone [Gemmatimonas sp.]
MRSSHSRSLALALTLSAFGPSLLDAQTPPAQRPPRPRAAATPAPGAAGPANAQSGPAGRVGGPGARNGRGGPGGGHPAAMLLRARTQLELTDDQVKRLEALAAAPAPKSNATDMMRAQADLLDATQGDGNLTGARAALDKLSRLRNDQLLARIKSQQDVRAVLTTTQKTKVDNMRQQLRSRVGAKRQRGMRQGGLPQGGMRQRGMRQGRGQMGPGMMPGMGPGMMPGHPQGGPQGPQGPMPRMRRGGDVPDTAPVPPVN